MTYDQRMTRTVLLLNATYEPIATVGVNRAINLILKAEAEIVSSEDGKMFRSAKLEFPWPTVIRLVKYTPVPRYRKAVLNRRAILRRDGYLCGYCMKKFPEKDLTMDHIMPRSRGGPNTWENVVSCCYRCNQTKDNHTPQEMGWKLNIKPHRPTGGRRLVLNNNANHPHWEEWLNMAG